VVLFGVGVDTIVGRFHVKHFIGVRSLPPNLRGLYLELGNDLRMALNQNQHRQRAFSPPNRSDDRPTPWVAETRAPAGRARTGATGRIWTRGTTPLDSD